MDTLTIKINDSRALKLIHDLEDLKLIQVLTSEKSVKGKLSSLLKGSISDKQADDLNSQIKEMRNEWDRNTF